MDEFQRKLLAEIEAERKKKQAQEWGRLGGRPQQQVKKSERITLRFTPEEMKKIVVESDKKKLNTTDYCRYVLLNKTLPDIESNLKMIDYTNNFSRLSNIIKVGIFNDEEKEYFMHELHELITDLRSKIKW